MANEDIKKIQQAIIDAGFSVGEAGADGIWGRDSQAGAKDYQRSVGFIGKDVDGIVGPRTIAKLFPHEIIDNVAKAITPPWYALALTKKGLIETTNNGELKKFLASDGHALGDPAKLPWCGDFVETCIALTLPKQRMVTNPYWAQNWVNFGKALKQGTLGAILVFGRTGGGHVAFYAGEDKDTFTILGGNQSNSVSIMRIAKNRLMPNGIRWPDSYVEPMSGVVTASGAPLSENEA